jgi:hypothetical protein
VGGSYANAGSFGIANKGLAGQTLLIRKGLPKTRGLLAKGEKKIAVGGSHA